MDYLVDCIPAAEHSDQVHLVAGSHSGDLHLLDMSDLEDVTVVKSLESGHSDTVRCLHWDKEVWVPSAVQLCFWGGGDGVSVWVVVTVTVTAVLHGFCWAFCFCRSFFSLSKFCFHFIYICMYLYLYAFFFLIASLQRMETVWVYYDIFFF